MLCMRFVYGSSSHNRVKVNIPLHHKNLISTPSNNFNGTCTNINNLIYLWVEWDSHQQRTTTTTTSTATTTTNVYGSNISTTLYSVLECLACLHYESIPIQRYVRTQIECGTLFSGAVVLVLDFQVFTVGIIDNCCSLFRLLLCMLNWLYVWWYFLPKDKCTLNECFYAVLSFTSMYSIHVVHRLGSHQNKTIPFQLKIVWYFETSKNFGFYCKHKITLLG